MFVAKSVETDHKDLIHDVAYDHYGRRMATCSSDQSIKVWDIAEDGTSQQVAHWKAHSGSVWRVTWAHPEFGQVLGELTMRGVSLYCLTYATGLI